MTIADIIKELPAVQIDALLRQLEKEKSRATTDKRPFPRLSVWLSSGQTISGEFVAFQSKTKTDSPVLLLQSNVGANSADVSYIPGNSIVGVTTHYLKENLHMLAFGAINEQLSGEPPTKMQLENSVSNWAAEFSKKHQITIDHQIAFSELPSSDQARFTLAKLIEVLQKDLEGIVGEQIGLFAIREQIKVIRVDIGSEPPRITLLNDTLFITCQKSSEDIKTTALGTLRQDIEALL